MALLCLPKRSLVFLVSVLAWAAAQYQWISTAPSMTGQWIQGQATPSKALKISCPATKVRIGEECSFKIDVLERDGFDQQATGVGCNKTHTHDGEVNAREKRNRSR